MAVKAATREKPALQNGEYFAATARVHCSAMARLTESLVTENDRHHAHRYRIKSRQDQSLAARALLRALLETSTDIPGTRWLMRTNEDGRLSATTDGLSHDLSVSLSHSGNRVACAVSKTGPIGVDVEFCRSDRDVRAIAEYAFTDDDTAAVRETGAAAFYRIWTMQEAVAKASGAGLAATLRRCRINAGPSTDRPSATLDGQRFQLDHRRLPDGYSLSLAVYAGGDQKPDQLSSWSTCAPSALARQLEHFPTIQERR